MLQERTFANYFDWEFVKDDIKGLDLRCWINISCCWKTINDEIGNKTNNGAFSDGDGNCNYHDEDKNSGYFDKWFFELYAVLIGFYFKFMILILTFLDAF